MSGRQSGERAVPPAFPGGYAANTFQRELVQRRIDGIAGKEELLSQRSRTGKLAAGQ